MRWSIRYQFLAPLLLLLVGLIGVGTWAALDSARVARQHLATQVHDIVRTLDQATYPLKAHVLDDMKGFSGAEFVYVEPSGQSIRTFTGSVDRLPPATAFTPSEEPRLGERVMIEGQAFLGRGILLRAPSPNAGGKLYVLFPESRRDDAVWQAVRPTLVLGVTVGLAALLLTAVGVRGIVRRVRGLERRTRVIAAGDFSPMPLPTIDDELRDLTQSVNEMAGKLALLHETMTKSERLRLLGQVSTGLAHQLRNAVTGAKLALQVHAQSCPGGDRDALGVAERQLDRMTVDLRRFFDLGHEQVQQDDCELSDLVSEAVDLLAPQCRHAGISVIWKPPPLPMVVAGNSGQIAHLVLNIVGNAVEAAGPGGAIEVSLIQQSSKCILTVWDTGPGPPSNVATRLFEPFVTGKPEGVGLGLSVSRQIVESHGGTIRWGREGNRTWFGIELPAKSAAAV